MANSPWLKFGRWRRNSVESRPFGLCAGQFTVPVDFDEPLPEEILREFEGA